MMNHQADTRSDATLVALVLAGERETFAPLLLRYYSSVARLCRRQLRRTLAPTGHEVLKPDRRPRKEHLMEASELVEVRIDSMRTSPLTLHRVVVLGEQGGERLLPIWIGPFEADVIQMALEGTPPHRPMTHDLALRLIEPLGGMVQQIVINRMTVCFAACAERIAVCSSARSAPQNSLS